MRIWAALLGATVAVSGFGQLPEVRLKLDSYSAYVARESGPSSFHLYDTLGRTSSLGLTFFLDSGLRAFISQRLQQIPGDPNHDPLDEYYVENEGIWRLGRQYLPFGTGRIFRESAVAARGDTNLILENLPVSVAICDNGPGLQRGIVARTGWKWFGASAAVGDHFGIAATSLDFIRRPDQSPGEGHGWKQVFGMDVGRKTTIFTVRGEILAFRQGDDPKDTDLNVLDVSATLDPSKYQSFTFGWTRRTPDRADFYRLMGSIWLAKNVSFEPVVRYKDDKFYDISLGLRVRF